MGRYWGHRRIRPGLHFEACYYQAARVIHRNGYVRFEGGAQGEHKMARGLLPVQTWSAHWLAHPAVRAQAVGDFLEREGAGVAGYIDARTMKTWAAVFTNMLHPDDLRAGMDLFQRTIAGEEGGGY